MDLCSTQITQLPASLPQDALVLHGWRLSNRTWNPITSPWLMQLTWLRIVYSGEWMNIQQVEAWDYRIWCRRLYLIWDHADELAGVSLTQCTTLVVLDCWPSFQGLLSISTVKLNLNLDDTTKKAWRSQDKFCSFFMVASCVDFMWISWGRWLVSLRPLTVWPLAGLQQLHRFKQEYLLSCNQEYFVII